MRIAGRLGSEVSTTSPLRRGPVSTGEIDRLCHEYMVNVQGCIPALNYAPPGYTPYPKSICTSVNHQGLSRRAEREGNPQKGDIVNLISR